MKLRRWLPAIPVLLTLLTLPAQAQELRAAVAANFLGTLQTLAERYEAVSGTRLVLSAGSSGALYAQIVNGAPFDLFLSADQERPEALERDGLSLTDSRFTYAEGIPVLWSPRPNVVDEDGAVLHGKTFRHLALADPRNAPYGAAAQQVLESIGAWHALNDQRRLVRAQSIGQAYNQVASGAAELGFVALTQVQQPDGSIPGSYWIPPGELYQPITQQAVILTRGNQQAAAAFMDWMRSEEALTLIRAAGYRIP